MLKTITKIFLSFALVIGLGTANVSLVSATSDTLTGGQSLTSGQKIDSANGQYKLEMQADGNLVEYFSGNPLWQSQTSGSGNYCNDANRR